MWWKLAGLLVLTAILIKLAIPFRTRAIIYDPLMRQTVHPLPKFWSLDYAYLTPGSAVIILVVLAAAGFVAIKVVRGQW